MNIDRTLINGCTYHKVYKDMHVKLVSSAFRFDNFVKDIFKTIVNHMKKYPIQYDLYKKYSC